MVPRFATVLAGLLGFGLVFGSDHAGMKGHARAAAVSPDCATAAPACAAVAPACAAAICQPTILYRHVGCRKVCCGCEPPIQTILEVKDPASCECALVAIPVCLPACCTDVPQVTSHCGMFGRGVVRFDYCCGLIIKVVFRNSGDILVVYVNG